MIPTSWNTTTSRTLRFSTSVCLSRIAVVCTLWKFDGVIFDERVSERDGNDNIYMYSVPYIYIYIMPPFKSTVVSTCRSSVNFARRNRIYLFFLKYLHKTLAAHVLSAYRILSRKRRRGKTFRDVAWSSVCRSGRVPIWKHPRLVSIYIYIRYIIRRQ